MYDQRNSQGQWPFLSMEGSPLRTDVSDSLSILNQQQKFPIYLLDFSIQKIGNVLERVFGWLSPPNRDTLSYVSQLQQVEIVLQNALHSQKGVITTRLRETMRIRLSNFSFFLQLKKCTAAAYSLWERAFQKMPDQRSNELTRLLIDCQLIAVNRLNHCHN